MKYNPQIHNRKSMRLKGYDYSQAGAYFITICTKYRQCFFGKIINGEMILNEYGIIACDEWLKLPKRFPNVELDVFQIMPNHIHGIIVLHETIAGSGFTPDQNDTGDIDNGARVNHAPAMVGEIIGAYKSLVANFCLEIYKTKNKIMGKLWQRNYHDNIIRNDKSYQTISEYIINNPAKWNEDSFNNA